MTESTIIYTLTDEAPALATRSLLPIISTFAAACGIDIETRDISLAARVVSQFNDRLDPEQQMSDDLAELGALTQHAGANIIKLPNISASVPQLVATIEELQARGIALPDYPEDAETPEELEIQARYDKVKGSAVNPVLREGNSDRRAPRAVKEYARKNPHSMGAWSADSLTHVSTMTAGDFRSNEKSITVDEDTMLRIELVHADGTVEVLKKEVAIEAGTIVDGTFMSIGALTTFLDEQIADAKAKGVLFSLHMKATMMKVSDPIIFGHAVRRFFAPVFDAHGAALDEAGANPNNGFGDVVEAIGELPDSVRSEVEAMVEAALADGPDMAMVNSDRGITNLHVPSDVIIDASMPAMIRTSGQMWNAAGEQQDAKATIPDSSYADLYEVTIADCKVNGAFDPVTMGTCLLYTSPSPRDLSTSRMPSSA